MHDIWFRRVVWVLDVSEVLGRAEDLEGKGVEKLPLREDAVSWLYPKPSFGLQVGRQLPQLRDPLGDTQSLVQLATLVQKSLTHRGLMECVQFGVDLLPEGGLLGRVLHVRDGTAHPVFFGHRGDKVSPGTILRVLELRMILALVDL